MIYEEELQCALARLLDGRRVSVDRHTWGDGCGTGSGKLGHIVNRDEAHTACAQRLHLWMVTVDRYLDTKLLRRRPDKRAFRHAHRLTIYRKLYQLYCCCILIRHLDVTFLLPRSVL